jgi:predicted nucleic acid-binding protein
MTRLLIDSSVVIKWFHSGGESEVAPARAIRDAHVRGDLQAHVIDLAAYEIGNVLLRALRWSADDVADQLDDIAAVVGPPLLLTAELMRRAAHLGEAHGLTFYDAAWASAAVGLGIVLVSADQRLQDAGLAESPTGTVERLRLRLA